MTRTFAPPVVAATTLVLVCLLFTETAGAETAFAVLALCLPALLLLLAEPSRGSGRLLLAAVASAVVSLAGGFVTLTVLSGARSTDSPAASLLVQVLVMTLAPLVVIGVLYALDFARFAPGEDEIERLRSLNADRD